MTRSREATAAWQQHGARFRPMYPRPQHKEPAHLLQHHPPPTCAVAAHRCRGAAPTMRARAVWVAHRHRINGGENASAEHMGRRRRRHCRCARPVPPNASLANFPGGRQVQEYLQCCAAFTKIFNGEQLLLRKMKEKPGNSRMFATELWRGVRGGRVCAACGDALRALRQ